MKQEAAASAGATWRLALYALTIFTGAFLLFQVQPIVGKYALPWFGGSAGVWAAALLFFQLFLLFGYAYAHVVSTWLGARGQSVVHLAILALALLALPIIPSDALKPDSADDPVRNIVMLLALTVGAPYLLLAANGPLLQGWFARDFPGRSPYRLYALSNVASLLALLSYPLAFERLLGLEAQAWLWSGTYLLFTALCGTVAWLQLRASYRGGNPVSTPASIAVSAAEAGERLEPFRVALWLLLPAIASALLLGTTNRLTQEIAPVPMLWVLPLSIYLVSFILTFDSDRWYFRPIYVPIVLACIAAATYTVVRPGHLTLVQEAAVLLGALYFVAMLCHGELVALRPGVRHLTMFYLAISAGGALGGAAVAIGAPALLDGYWEYHLALSAGAVAVVSAMVREVGRARASNQLTLALFGVGLTIGAALTVGLVLRERVLNERAGKLLVTRNFYSAVQVQEVFAEDPVMRQYQMVHGQTLHGLQFLAPERRAWHTSYFSEQSGFGLALRHHPNRDAGKPLRVGIIGLGTGSLASYGQSSDLIEYYEIDPQVETIAREQFSYLGDAEARGASVEVLLGDARIVLERQLDAGDLQRFDVFIVDAFNSDSVPVHLLTTEALDLYRQHLNPDGILGIHVSNRFLDLTPVVRALASHAGLETALITSSDNRELSTNRSEFVLMTNNRAFLEAPEVAQARTPMPSGRPELLWTDNYSALLPLLRF